MRMLRKRLSPGRGMQWRLCVASHAGGGNPDDYEEGYRLMAMETTITTIRTGHTDSNSI